MPYITPPSTPDELVCRVLLIPNDLYWLAAVQGALDELTRVHNWEQVSGITAQEAAERALELVNQTYESNCMPIGSVIAYAGNAAPDGYLICDGSQHLKANYPELANILAPGFEDDFDNDYFFLPDLRDKFIYGTDEALESGDIGGQASVTLTEAQLPEVTVGQKPHNHTTSPHTHTNQPHWHGYQLPVSNLDLEAPGAPDILGLGLPFTWVQTATNTIVIDQTTVAVDYQEAENDPFGSGESHTNIPPFCRLMYIIRVTN